MTVAGLEGLPASFDLDLDPEQRVQLAGLCALHRATPDDMLAEALALGLDMLASGSFSPSCPPSGEAGSHD